MLVKGAPAGAATRAANDLVLSKEAQTALLENAFHRPSRSDIDMSKHVELPAIESVEVFAIDEDAASKRDEFLKRRQSYATVRSRSPSGCD
ncbi:iron(III) transport system substrate-binding protein [Bosea lupini]|uniref:Iron(III) transport system substrate-binding protein n=1 Tax=Bosea lupini TaxID=1036779 RepID=A0A1H7PWM6_9HYPH|nr:iron(III) transport system substrate-binding protein [Bosea lupini]